jgi:hypothetical protein
VALGGEGLDAHEVGEEGGIQHGSLGDVRQRQRALGLPMNHHARARAGRLASSDAQAKSRQIREREWSLVHHIADHDHLRVYLLRACMLLSSSRQWAPSDLVLHIGELGRGGVGAKAAAGVAHHLHARKHFRNYAESLLHSNPQARGGGMVLSEVDAASWWMT